MEESKVQAQEEVEESKAPVKQQPIQQANVVAANTRPKPSFESLISFQLTDGKWNTDCEGILKEFFIDSNINDSVIDQVIEQAKANGSLADPLMIHYTIIALYVLKGTFNSKQEEWQMIAKKAKDWLKSVKVPNVDKHIKKLKLSLKP